MSHVQSSLLRFDSKLTKLLSGEDLIAPVRAVISQLHHRQFDLVPAFQRGCPQHNLYIGVRCEICSG